MKHKLQEASCGLDQAASVAVPGAFLAGSVCLCDSATWLLGLVWLRAWLGCDLGREGKSREARAQVRLGTYRVAPPAACVAARLAQEDPRAEPAFGERVPYLVVCGAPSEPPRLPVSFNPLLWVV